LIAAFEIAEDNLGTEIFFALEMIVKRALGHTRGFGNVLHAGRIESSLVQDRQAGIEEKVSVVWLHECNMTGHLDFVKTPSENFWVFLPFPWVATEGARSISTHHASRFAPFRRPFGHGAENPFRQERGSGAIAPAAAPRAAWRRADPGNRPTERVEEPEWAENCPANLEDSAALTGADVARIEGRETDAIQLY